MDKGLIVFMSVAAAANRPGRFCRTLFGNQRDGGNTGQKCGAQADDFAGRKLHALP